MKTGIKYLLLVTAILFSGYSVAISIDYLITEKTYMDCGLIVSRSTDEIVIKHGTRTDLYLNVQFDKSGFRSIKVNPTTYFKYKKGERICFDLKKEISIKQMILITIGEMVIVLCLIVVIFLFFNWLFTESKI